MTLAEMILEIRELTDHDSDTQFDSTRLTAFLTRKAGDLFRRLSRAFPELYETTTGGTALSPSVTSITKPATFGSIIRVEMQVPGSAVWSGIMKASQNPENDGFIGWRETGTAIVFTPAAALAGTARLVYRRAPTNVAAYTYVEADILPGFENVLIEYGKGYVLTRTKKDDGTDERAEALYKEVRRGYLARAGSSPEPGFTSVYGD
jgi:hypothetical protein